VALGLKLGAQSGVVIDLAVISEHYRAVLVGHRLSAGLREVDDRKSPMTEGDPLRWVAPDTLSIGATVDKARAHPSDRALVEGQGVGPAQDAADATHRRILSVAPLWVGA
jgi:hypothetical protein